MYNNNSFIIKSIAPAYDFNNAFEPIDDISNYYEWIYENLKTFIDNNEDIKSNLSSNDFVELIKSLGDLNEQQQEAVLSRSKYLTGL